MNIGSIGIFAMHYVWLAWHQLVGLGMTGELGQRFFDVDDKLGLSWALVDALLFSCRTSDVAFTGKTSE